MENTTSKKNSLAWVWALGCLVLISICSLLLIGAGVLAAVFTVSRTVTPFDGLLDETINDGATTVVDPPHDSKNATDGSTPEPALRDTDPFSGKRSEIEANVVDIRQLAPKETVVPTLLTMEELRVRLEEEFAEDYSPEEASLDAIALSAFDFISPDFDIYNYVIDLLTEQIAGFYDPETDEFALIDDDDEFDALEQWTHAHEYVHALQDQHYGLEMLDDKSLDSDTLFALQALAEGDATFVQNQYLIGGYFDREQMFDLLGEAINVDTAILNSAPPILAHELEFPYISGLGFVQALYEDGGFAAVDRAWENPPQSTEQIIHPERYLSNDNPEIVSLEPLTKTLGIGWQLADEDTLGEFYLREYLLQQLDDSQVNEAATGWGGDRYAVYWNEADQDVLMVLKLAWDTAADADEFYSIYANYPTRLFGTQAESQPDGGLCWTNEDVICIHRASDEILIVRAPDLAMALKVASVQNR